MSEIEAEKLLAGAVAVLREDVARAKTFLLQANGGSTDELAGRFLSGQGLAVPRAIDGTVENLPEVLTNAGRAVGVRMALFQAAWELVAAGELIPAGPPARWDASFDYKQHRHAGGLRPKVGCSYPSLLERMPLTGEPSTDVDIFLRGGACESLHDGIKEAIEQSLGCYRRGLYMPATVMLAAAAEATWVECGKAVAKELGNAKLGSVVSDPMSGIAKVVTETRKALEHGDAKDLLKAGGQHISRVGEAEVWTNALRERRNALHWGKGGSFLADHSETGTLLMAAPLCLGTLEAIRKACRGEDERESPL